MRNYLIISALLYTGGKARGTLTLFNKMFHGTQKVYVNRTRTHA